MEKVTKSCSVGEEKVGWLHGVNDVLVRNWLEKTVTLQNSERGKYMLRQVLLIERLEKGLQKAAQSEKNLQGFKVVLVRKNM